MDSLNRNLAVFNQSFRNVSFDNCLGVVIGVTLEILLNEIKYEMDLFDIDDKGNIAPISRTDVMKYFHEFVRMHRDTQPAEENIIGSSTKLLLDVDQVIFLGLIDIVSFHKGKGRG